MNLTVEGMSCVECLQEITEKLKRISVIEKAHMSIHNKKAVFEGDPSVPQKEFLKVLADTPYLFRNSREETDCQCCTEFYFSFS